MNPTTRRKLVEFYRPHNEELQRLLGKTSNEMSRIINDMGDVNTMDEPQKLKIHSGY